MENHEPQPRPSGLRPPGGGPPPLTGTGFSPDRHDPFKDPQVQEGIDAMRQLLLLNKEEKARLHDFLHNLRAMNGGNVQGASSDETSVALRHGRIDLDHAECQPLRDFLLDRR